MRAKPVWDPFTGLEFFFGNAETDGRLTAWHNAGNRANELTYLVNISAVVDTIAIRSDTTTALSKAAAESKYLLAVGNVFESKACWMPDSLFASCTKNRFEQSKKIMMDCNH